MWIEIDDELWPLRKSLMGLQFATPEDFARAQEIVALDPDLYREIYRCWSMIVVRRDDVHRFAAAGLRYAEIEQLDDEDLSPEDVAKRDRALIDWWKPILFGGARPSR
jgi:hypothetical protein